MTKQRLPACMLWNLEFADNTADEFCLKNKYWCRKLKISRKIPGGTIQSFKKVFT